jgi:hypothetical protein
MLGFNGMKSIVIMFAYFLGVPLFRREKKSVVTTCVDFSQHTKSIFVLF